MNFDTIQNEIDEYIHTLDEVAEGNNATISTGTANEETQPSESEATTPEVSATPEPTEEPVAELSDEWSEKIPWGDLDGDGTEEYILLETGDFLGQNVVNGRITMYVNDEPSRLLTTPPARREISLTMGAFFSLQICSITGICGGTIAMDISFQSANAKFNYPGRWQGRDWQFCPVRANSWSRSNTFLPQ